MTAVPVEVRPGQIWADNDPRSEGRKVKVMAIVYRHLAGPPPQDPRGTPYALVQHPSGTGRITRIRLDRFKPTATGYRLVSEPEGER